MMGTAIAAAFIRQWPYQMTFTLAHFNFDQVDGGGWLAFGNSLRMALATAVLGSILVFLGAWSSCKLRSARLGSTLLHAIAMLPMAVPGWCWGWVTSFSSIAMATPCMAVRQHGHSGAVHGGAYTTTAHMTARTALTQLDPDFEPVAASLKVPLWLTLWRVTVPACLPAILEIARYFFVSAMTTVSAVIFLYPGHRTGRRGGAEHG
jgi:iron(III) transport system permease protein